MFGPNTARNFSSAVRSSHRSQSAGSEISELKDLIRDSLGKPDWEIMILFGSGTLAMESLIASCQMPVHMENIDGTFGQRWQSMIEKYQAGMHKVGVESTSISVLFETSTSLYRESSADIVDAICAFPYFPVPQSAKAMVFGPNKMIGSVAGLNFVAADSEYLDGILGNQEFSVLSLSNYRDFSAKNSHPTTYPDFLVSDLIDKFSSLDPSAVRRRIDEKFHLLVELFDPDAIIGSRPSPVLTVKQEALPASLIEKWELYTKPTSGGICQIFLYSEDDALYYQLARDLRLL